MSWVILFLGDLTVSVFKKKGPFTLSILGKFGLLEYRLPLFNKNLILLKYILSKYICLLHLDGTQPPPPSFQNFVSICIVKAQKWSSEKQKKNGNHGKK